MVDFGDDTAGERFNVVRSSHRFPPMFGNLRATQHIHLMPVNRIKL
jgi:hypothetical protein